METQHHKTVDPTKQVLRWKFIVINAYFKKNNPQINLILSPEELSLMLAEIKKKTKLGAL